MRKVLLGTPCYDGQVNVEFLHSLLGTLSLSSQHDVAIYPIQICHDALIQRARNDLVRMALESDCDHLVFVDSDQEWDPEWIFKLLDHPVDLVAGTVPKKSDVNIDFNVKALPEGLPEPVNGLIEVESVGTGFISISKKALQTVWDMSPEYKDSGKTTRMAFDVQIRDDGDLISEDNVFCAKWRKSGGKVWIDPTMTCNHIGNKKYQNNFLKFIEKRNDRPN
jgi:hypothetical protein